jgi:predicted metal-binding protein
MKREETKGGRPKAQDQAGRLHAYLEAPIKGGADHAVLVETARVVTAPWVRLKCRFGCALYGGCLCCPPHSPTPEEMRAILDSCSYAILLHRRATKKSREAMEALNEAAVDLERMLFLDGYYKAWATGSGPCDRCPVCDTSGACRHPDRARPSMESCGIDVFATARAYDLPIHVVRTKTEEKDFYALVLVE